MLCVAIIMIFVFGSLHAGQPSRVEDAEPLEKHVWEVEMGFELHRQLPERHLDFPVALAFATHDFLEIGIGSGAHLHDEIGAPAGGIEPTAVRGIMDLEIVAKWLFISAEHYGIALVPAIVLPTASKSKKLSCGRAEFGLTVATTYKSQQLSWDLNLAYVLPGSSLQPATALRYALNPDVELLTELMLNINPERDHNMELAAGCLFGNLGDFSLFAGLGTGFGDGSADISLRLGMVRGAGQ